MNTLADPDFAQAVVDDLYRYRTKRTSVAWALLILTGILGGHRFYLGQGGRGLLYLLSAGGGLVLWLRDFGLIKQLVSEYNAREEAAQQSGMPPQALKFLPPIAEINLQAPPLWAARRSGRSVLVGGSILLLILGLSMGTIAGATGVIEPLVIMVLFMAITLVAARLPLLRKVPILAGLSRWNHRLRLYYFTTDPGSVWMLAARPYVGLLIAPWRAQSRAEVRLYLQLGLTFGVGFMALDLYELREYGFWASFGLIVAELAQTVVYTYVFVAPVGAILLTQQLIARKDGVVLLMSLATLGCAYVGLWLVGAV